VRRAAWHALPDVSPEVRLPKRPLGSSRLVEQCDLSRLEHGLHGGIHHVGFVYFQEVYVRCQALVQSGLQRCHFVAHRAAGIRWPLRGESG